ncbi:MAG TPA: DUF6036 family nucleotidyltransferase [Myxococcales bacterium]|nr:DUF6036 family nucleotidyltransferase [Myxococcales bacterium]
MYLDEASLRAAFKDLDGRLKAPVRLVVGGGTALMLADHFPVRTTDVDAYPVGLSMDELDPAIKAVARKLGLPADWINPHFSTFAYVLPPDYRQRLRSIFEGKQLTVEALGPEDLLLMKCFAGRTKDVGHAKALLKRGVDLALVERRLQDLLDKRVPKAQDAMDFLDDLQDQ